MKHVAIIGGGITGVSAAYMLQEMGIRATLFEASDQLGGLIKCKRSNGHLYHLVGGHVFNTKSPEVEKWFWQRFNRDDFFEHERNASICIENSFIGYPIEDHIYQLPADVGAKIINDLVEKSTKRKKAASNFQEFLRENFGDTLFELYFKPYNEKIWMTDLSEIALDWLEGKLPMPKLQEILYHNIYRTQEKQMVHSRFYYPKKDGSQFIVDQLAKNLEVHCQTPVYSVENRDNQWEINGQNTFDAVLYCGPITKLSDLLHKFKNHTLDQHLRKLTYHGTSNVICETDEMPYTWLYIPDSNIKAHRIIYTGNLAPSNNGGNQRKSCVVEFSGNLSAQEMEKEIIKLPGNLRMLDWNYAKYTYIIQTSSTRTLIDQVKTAVEPQGLFLAGRFAEWEYYNMDTAIRSAMMQACQIEAYFKSNQ